MKVTIVGAGSAGLSAGIIFRGLFDADVTVLERANEGEAPGLGVALLPFALDELARLLKSPYRPPQRAPVPISSAGLGPHADTFFAIDRVMRVFAGQSNGGEIIERTRTQGIQYAGVKRAALVEMLTGAARSAGVKIEYGCDISEARVHAAREGSDLLIGADGAGSVVRSTFEAQFHPVAEDAKSRFAWLDLEGRIERFTFGYMYVAGKGLIRVSAYPHSKTESSAIVTHSMGLTKFFDGEGMTEGEGFISDQGLRAINEIFSACLGGRKLGGRSRWRRFRATHCQRAAFDNVALLGDAHATLFYETGWGTSAAIQEASVLGQTMLKGRSFQEGLEIFDRKSTEIAQGAIAATLKAMRQIDGQAAKFYQLGPEKFLALKTA